jgi:predicted transcriptional regulator
VFEILQDLCNLLFEFSNIDRLNILLELRKKPLKLSSVAKKFRFTVPETARNISRLQEVKLISKDVGGCFHLTPYGEETLNLLEGFRFISNNREYFLTHTPSRLPLEFAVGLVALKKCEFISQFTEMLQRIENIIREAQEYVWFIADQLLASGLPLAVVAVKRGVEFRKILPKNIVLPASILELANNPVFYQAARKKKFESRYLDRVDVALFISEKNVTGISFPNLAGKFDYVGFSNGDESAHSWSKSLFSYYWDRASASPSTS